MVSLNSHDIKNLNRTNTFRYPEKLKVFFTNKIMQFQNFHAKHIPGGQGLEFPRSNDVFSLSEFYHVLSELI